MSEEIRKEFIARIQELETQIMARYNSLNVEAIWLFVATLGCWGVDNTYMKFFALIIVLLFFYSKVSKDKKYETTFFKVLDRIRIDVEASELNGDSKKARLHEIDDVKKNLLGVKSIYKSTPMFLAGYGFWSISLLIFCYRLVTEIRA